MQAEYDPKPWNEEELKANLANAMDVDPTNVATAAYIAGAKSAIANGADVRHPAFDAIVEDQIALVLMEGLKK